MYTLYYLPGACSLAVHVVLNEVNAEFMLENVSVPPGQPRTPEYLRINPRGSVPVLKDNDFILREGAAILMYLIDKHKSHLLPHGEKDRAKALEWLCFINATLHPAYGRIFFLHRTLGDAAAESPIYGPFINQIQKYWDEIEQQLIAHPYLCGQECTVADILVTVIANWSLGLRRPVELGPRTRALFGRVVARPSYQKAMSTEGITYKILIQE